MKTDSATPNAETPFTRFSNGLTQMGDDHSLALGAFAVFVSSLPGPSQSSPAFSDPMMIDDPSPSPKSPCPRVNPSTPSSSIASPSPPNTPSFTNLSPTPSLTDRSRGDDYFFLSFHLRGRGVFPMPVRKPTPRNKQSSTAGKYTRSLQELGADWSTSSIYSTQTTQSA
ncbi:hypothetical protein BJ742DRAFT_788529 [Cladochytrium replicatum]|nr:hypothetical protein BJ742DRAFT_788529 [Cladochytrium replicatum]